MCKHLASEILEIGWDLIKGHYSLLVLGKKIEKISM